MVEIWTQDNICPACGITHTAATCVTGAHRPKPGDCSICVTCLAVSVFTETGLRPPTRAELVEFMADPEVRKAIQAMAAVKSGSPGV